MSDLGQAERTMLLDCARRSIASALGVGAKPDLTALRAAGLRQPLGAFVTVKRGGMLRGCRGILETEAPLYETIARVARLSAFDDPRFPPMVAEELEGMELDVSVLHAQRPIRGPEEIVIGRDGLLLTYLGRRGFLLPQVAVEHELDAETFLDRLCQKAGVPVGSWREPEARLEAFAVEHFDSQEPARPVA